MYMKDITLLLDDSLKLKMSAGGIIAVIFFFLLFLALAAFGIAFFIYKKFGKSFKFLTKIFEWLEDKDENKENPKEEKVVK